MLYHHKDITIVSKYEACDGKINCQCALYMRLKNSTSSFYVFIDNCGKEPTDYNKELMTYDGVNTIGRFECPQSGNSQNGFKCVGDDLNYLVSVLFIFLN